MKKFLTLSIIIITMAGTVSPQVIIKSGTTVNVKGGTYIVMQGNYSNGGTFIASSGSTVLLTGSTAQGISSVNEETFDNLTINKSSEGVTLNNDITINGVLTITSGSLNLNNNSLNLGEQGSVLETAGNSITGGNLSTTMLLNAPNSVNIGGLGALISSGTNLGSTHLTRGSSTFSVGGNTSIKRYYNISPANNSGLNATLVFSYDESELNGINEANLVLFRSTDNGTTWTQRGGIVDTENNTITLASIDAFSSWTAGDVNAPLPVELNSFTASLIGNAVNLNWGTATEVNNYGFQVERSMSKSQNEAGWESIGFVNGNGNSNSPKSYSFTDVSAPVSAGKVYYRLKQIDTDGQFEYSEVIEVTLSLPTVFKLEQNYPNPFNPSTEIRYQVPAASHVMLTVYDILGNKITTLVNEVKEAGRYQIDFTAAGLSSGLYLYRFEAGKFVQLRKMMILK